MVRQREEAAEAPVMMLQLIIAPLFLLMIPPRPHRWPRGRGVVTVERVLPHVWSRLASEDALMRVLPIWDALQRCPAGDAHVQQHVLLSRWTWNRGLGYVLTFSFFFFFFFERLFPPQRGFWNSNNRTLTVSHSRFIYLPSKCVMKKNGKSVTQDEERGIKRVTSPPLSETIIFRSRFPCLYCQQICLYVLFI